MKKASQNENPISGTPGGSSLMVIFAVLCLTVFAILALSTVLADSRLSNAYADNVTAYYAADGEAEKIIANLRTGVDVHGVEKNNNIYTLHIPISDSQTLVIVVRVEGEEWELISRTTIYSADWQSENSLLVWDGE